MGCTMLELEETTRRGMPIYVDCSRGPGIYIIRTPHKFNDGKDVDREGEEMSPLQKKAYIELEDNN